MNWLNDVFNTIQTKLLSDTSTLAEKSANPSRRMEKESMDRLHQFQSRLADLDKRILELR